MAPGSDTKGPNIIPIANPAGRKFSTLPAILPLPKDKQENGNGQEDDSDFFVTQRGGKMSQSPYAVLATMDEKANKIAPQQSNKTLQSTLLLQKKKESQIVQEQLEKKRQEFAKRMEECREKREELKSKQKQIRDRVLKFEKFLKENEAKRQRANTKAQSEKRLREQKEVELLGLQKQLQQQETKGERIKTLIVQYQIYEKYLQRVIDELPPDYLDLNEPHINDILMRQKTLVETNEDLKKSVHEFAEWIENEQKEFNRLIKEKNDQILVYNSQLGTSQKKLDKLKQESAYLEQKLEERDFAGQQRMRILGETKLAIDNIYSRAAVKNGHSNKEDINIMDKISAIQERVIDLSRILTIIRSET